MTLVNTTKRVVTATQILRAWSRDGSSNVMSLDAAAENLRYRMTAESWDVVMSYGERNVESIKAALLAGAVLETTWADFRKEGHGHA